MKKIITLMMIALFSMIAMVGCDELTDSAASDSTFTTEEKAVFNAWYDGMAVEMDGAVSLTKSVSDAKLTVNGTVLVDIASEGWTAGDTIKFDVTKSNGTYTGTFYLNGTEVAEMNGTETDLATLLN